VNPYSASSSFLERVEQDLQMRRSLAARSIKVKIDEEDAQVAKSRLRKKKLAPRVSGGAERTARSRREAEDRARRTAKRFANAGRGDAAAARTSRSRRQPGHSTDVAARTKKYSGRDSNSGAARTSRNRRNAEREYSDDDDGARREPNQMVVQSLEAGDASDNYDEFSDGEISM